MVKLFSKNSNLCDHNSPTLQTDRQTTCDRNTALCTKVHRAVIKWWYCSWPVAPTQCCFLFVFCNSFVFCMIVLFVDNLFFYLGSQSVSCKASLAALRLYGYFCDIFVMMLLSENKYDDDDDV